MNWKEFGGLPGKTISGLEGAQFLRTFMQTNGALSLMLSQDEGKMPEPSDYMNFVFELDGGFSIPYDLMHAGLDSAWIDCVGSVAARVIERRKKQLGLN